MGSNAELKQLIQRTSAKVSDAKSGADIDAVFKELKAFSTTNGLAFDNTGAYKASLILAVLLFFIWCVAIYAGVLSSKNSAGLLAIVMIAIALVPLLFAASRGTKLEELADAIFTRDIEFDNGLVRRKVAGKKFWSELKSQFGDFNRGDKDQEIRGLRTGRYENNGTITEYSWYAFRYVDRVTETYYDVISKTTKTRTVDRESLRYGLLLDTQVTGFDLCITDDSFVSDYDAQWESALAEFNSRFNVSGRTEIEMAKFFAPAVVLAFTQLPEETLSGFCLQIRPSGKLCLSFDDEDVLSMARENGLTDLAAFETEISKKRRPAKLYACLKLLTTIVQFNDKNFRS